MVGRSKPQKKMERKLSVDITTAENAYLKAKNRELAKGLAESKAACSQMVEDRDLLQRELFATSMRCTKLENYIKTMESTSRACMNSIVMLSNHTTELLQTSHAALHLSLGDNNTHISMRASMPNSNAHSSPVSNKTQAVKPMIGGHVILRPTINLRRVNEIPLEEIQRLQSGGQIPTANRNSSENNISSIVGNQNQNDSPTRSRSFRSHQQSNSAAESFDNHNDTEDEYTDHTSEISDPPSEMNNGLDTVQEEQEDDLQHSLAPETHINPLGNTSNSSLSISGSSSQVPLLSGVFRDVRVYLSPMRNVAQYLDPHQHVTTERGSSKTHVAKRSRSGHSPRSIENIPRSSSGTAVQNRRLSATNLNSSNTAQNQTSSANTSLEESFASTLQNSLLSSTKISTPKSMRTSVTKPEDLNWINVSNKYKNSNRAAFSESSECTFNNVSNPKFLTVKQRRSNNSFVRKAPDHSRPSHLVGNRKCDLSTTDYDPLEGPSNMLDSFDAETINKIETMSGLGLTPTFLDSSKRTSDPPPPSPARTVLQRRERRKSDEKVKKSLYVTKRTNIEKKKSPVIATKLAKVLVKRLSKRQLSGSPQRRNSSSPRKSLDGSQKRKSLNSSQRSENRDGEEKRNSSASSASSSSMAPSRSSGKEKQLPKKRGRRTKQELADSMNSKKSESPQSPRRGRPRRGTVQTSLKEPSLVKKLRRSK